MNWPLLVISCHSTVEPCVLEYGHSIVLNLSSRSEPKSWTLDPYKYNNIKVYQRVVGGVPSFFNLESAKTFILGTTSMNSVVFL